MFKNPCIVRLKGLMDKYSIIGKDFNTFLSMLRKQTDEEKRKSQEKNKVKNKDLHNMIQKFVWTDIKPCAPKLQNIHGFQVHVTSLHKLTICGSRRKSPKHLRREHMVYSQIGYKLIRKRLLSPCFRSEAIHFKHFF
jgi:hypothetical protein